MITVENHTPGTITVVSLTDGLQEYVLKIGRDDKVNIMIKDYSEVVLESPYGRIIITTFEHSSSVVNYGNLRSELKLSQGKIFLPVTLKEHM